MTTATADREKNVSGLETTVPYTPPPQFKLIDTPPLIQEVPPDNTELWLVRIQDSQLGPDEFKEKRVTMALRSLDDRLGCFENSKGTEFEILHQVGGVQPFAFLPKGNATSLEVHKVSRQVSIVRSLDRIVLKSPFQNDYQDSSPQADGTKKIRSPSKQRWVSSSFHDDASAGDTAAQDKHEESQPGSASIGMTVEGISAVESLQENEERISTGNLGKSGKKSKREQPTSDLDSSPLRSSQNDSRGGKERTSSGKKSRKHKKVKMGETQH